MTRTSRWHFYSSQESTELDGFEYFPMFKTNFSSVSILLLIKQICLNGNHAVERINRELIV